MVTSIIELQLIFLSKGCQLPVISTEKQCCEFVLMPVQQEKQEEWPNLSSHEKEIILN